MRAFRILKRVIVAAAFSAASSFVIAQPAADVASDRVGATAGTFRVDESGQASYRIPLYTVPGTAGVKPDLSLAYSSMGGDGPLGRGWSISGLSSISRCRASREAGDFIVGGAPVDGDPMPVNLSATDRFCLDGQRLIAVANTPACTAVSGMAVTQLRTEIESFQRVCAYSPTAASANGPAFFTVERKDGSTSWYGDRDNNASANRPDGYVNATTPGHTEKALSWAQTRFQDSTGNYIDYLYAENPGGVDAPGEHVVSEVRWTGKTVLSGQSGTALAPYARLVFDYMVKFPNEWSRGYVAGGPTTQTQWLVGVRSFGDGQLVRYYEPTYGSSSSGSGALQMRSIRECSDSARTVCLAPTTFAWSQAAHDFGAMQQAPSGPFNNQVKFEGFKLGDVDGDGRLDMAWLDDGSSGSTCPTEHIYVSFGGTVGTAQGFYQVAQAPTCSPQEMGNEDRHWYLFDYNGDGRDDLFITGGGGWMIFPSRGRPTSGSAFDTGNNLLAGLSPAIPSGIGPQLADLNGDGVLDVIYSSGEGLRTRLSERTGAGFRWGSERLVDVGTLFPSDCSRFDVECSTSPVSLGNNSRALQLYDIDGDARADIVLRIRTTRQIPTGSCAPSVVRSAVTPCFVTETTTALHALVVQSVSASQVSLRRAGSWAVSYSPTGAYETISLDLESFVDLNADGLVDLVYRAGGSDSSPWYYALNTGGAFTTARPIQGTDAASVLPAGRYAQVLDVTGDGRADLVYPAESYRNYHVMPALPAGGFGPGRAISTTALINCTDDCMNRGANIFSDFDGDGGLDFVRALFVSSTGSPSVRQTFSRPTMRYTPRDTIVSITSGFGAVTDITYRPMTLGAVHRRPLSASRDAVNWGRSSAVQDLIGPMYVVTEVSSSAPVEGLPNQRSRVLYQYFEGRMQGGGRGFLGFRGIFTYDVNRPNGQHVLSRDYYYQNFPFNGMPDQSLKQVVSGTPAIAINTISGARSPFSAECRSATPEDYCFLAAGNTNYPDPGFGGYFTYNYAAVESAPAFSPGAQQPLQARVQRTEDFAGGFETGANAKVVTAFVYDAWGNPTSTTVTTASWPANVVQGSVTTTAAYTNDGARWRLGRLTSSTVTHARNGKPSIARSTSFAYSMAGPVTGLLERETIQPGGTANLTLRTLYALDAFGNRTAKHVCSSDLTDTACRAASTAFRSTSETHVHRYSRTEFDTIGRYPVRTFEPFWSGSNNTTVERTTLQIGGRNVHGDPTSQSDVNGVQMQFGYGSFGRPYYAWTQTVPSATLGNTAQGVESIVTYRWCAGFAPSGQPSVSCPQGAVFREQKVKEAAPTQWTYHDTLGRAMATVNETLEWNVTGRQFALTCGFWNAAGLAASASQPAFLTAPASDGAPVFPAGACSAGAVSRMTYDAQGRLVRTTTPHQAFDDATAETQYNGLVLTQLDPRGNARVEERNAFGDIIRVTDGVGSTALYDYGAAGSLLTVTRNAGRGDVVSSFTYDVLGRKTSQSDPDTGTWTYVSNAAGEVVRTVSARGVTKADRYDVRGRLFRHTVTPAGSSVAEFEDRIDHDQGTGGIGQANKTCRWRPNASNVLTEAHCALSTFDAMGRVSQTSERLSGVTSAISTVLYDGLSRVVESSDATGKWLRTDFGPRGHAIRLCEGTGSGLPGCVPDGAQTWHQVLEADPRGSVTLEKRGPTFLRRSYDLVGRLVEQTAGTSPGGTSVQWERYGYDKASNLDFRERVGSFKERFAYDGADRLTRSWHEMLGGVTYGAAPPSEDAINAVESMRFDAFGNLCFQRSTGYSWAYGGRAGCGLSGLPGSGNGATPTGTHQAQELRVAGLVIPIQFDANGNQSRALENGAVVKGWDYDGSVYGMARTTRYFGNMERIERNGQVSWRRTIAGIAVQTFGGVTANPAPVECDCGLCRARHAGPLRLTTRPAADRADLTIPGEAKLRRFPCTSSPTTPVSSTARITRRTTMSRCART
jgi:hypothetical protein